MHYVPRFNDGWAILIRSTEGALGTLNNAATTR